MSVVEELIQPPPSRMPQQFARNLAKSEDTNILLVSGPIPMDIGYPQKHHNKILQLITLSTDESEGRKIAYYRILDERTLYLVIEDMEHHGGYRCALYRPDGSLDSGYYI